jgi:hypothetical protein
MWQSVVAAGTAGAVELPDQTVTEPFTLLNAPREDLILGPSKSTE